MSVEYQLTERHKHILKATIKHYIATAEPVGSKTLIEEYDFSVSSATIRNVMGYLEKVGLLYQPHISAGRVPSDEGYRIYVDELITFDTKSTQNIVKSLQKHLNQQTWSFEALLTKATKFLASVSGYIALVTIPQTNQLRHLQLLLTESQQIILIIVTDSYQTQSFVVDSVNQYSFSESELQILSNFLNHQLKGKYLSELANVDWENIDQQFKHYTDFLAQLLKNIAEHHFKSSYSLVFHGIAELLRQPEFSQPEASQMLFDLLEKQQEQIYPMILTNSASPEGKTKAMIKIGSENNLEPMRNCSIVYSLYHKGNVPLGSVAIIGPTRMLYENTISLVESTAAYLSATITA